MQDTELNQARFLLLYQDREASKAAYFTGHFDWLGGPDHGTVWGLDIFSRLFGESLKFTEVIEGSPGLCVDLLGLSPNGFEPPIELTGWK